MSRYECAKYAAQGEQRVVKSMTALKITVGPLHTAL